MTLSRLLVLFALPCFLFASLSARADGGDEEGVLFPGSTVSVPEVRAHRIDESPSSVTVISGEAIRRSGALTVPEALSLLPGVDLMRLSEAGPQLSIRGFNGYSSNKVLVMLDSRPLFNLADASVDWNLIPVSVDDIDRIELARGPGSALHGENAFFGVINIITKSAGKSEKSAAAGGGSGPSARVYGALAGKGVRASVEALELDRFDEASSDLPNTYLESEGVLPIASRTAVQRGFLKTELANEKARLTLSGGMARAENKGPEVENVDRASFASAELCFSAARIDFTSSLRAGYQDRSADGNQAFPDGPYRDSLRLDYEMQGSSRPFSDDLLMVGARYSHQQIRDEVYLGEDKDKSRDVASAYLENQFALFERSLYITGGLRLDGYPEVGDVLSPRAGVIWMISSEQAVKAYWGQAFRSPTLYELYGVDDGMDPIIFLGNANLEPERISSVNLDYIYNDPGRLELAVNLFYHDIKDLIVYKQVYLTPSRRAFQLDNEEKALAYGGEFAARVHIGRRFEVWGNYSYDHAVYERVGETIEAPFSPRHKGHIGVDLDGQRWNASVWTSHVGGYTGVSQNSPFTDRIDVNGYSYACARCEFFLTEQLSISAMAGDAFGKGHYESPIHAPVMPYYFISLSWLDVR